MKILVTGGAGYIGSHTCRALAAAGFLPVTYDNLSRGNAWAVKWGPLEEGDIADAERLRSVLEKHRPAALLHFAAYAYVGESVTQPMLYYENNFVGSLSLLRAILRFQRMPVVFSSSCATYGIPDATPIPEGHHQRPINPYGYSKLFVEQLIKDLGATEGLPWVVLRYFNAAGADPQGEIGEAHDPETHLIPLVIGAAHTGGAVKIFGDDYSTPDGTCIRDYVHVSDIADAHVQALSYLLQGGTSCAFNLANARGHSVKEVIATAQRVCGRPINAQIAPRRPGDPPILVGDATLARKVLSWQPRRSDLETQVRDAWNWIKQKDDRGS